MKDVTDLVVTQIRVFAANTFPLVSLMTGKGLTELKERFDFSRVGLVDSNEIAAEGGTLRDKSDRAITIARLQIGERRTQLAVLGTSLDAEQVHDAFSAFVFSAVRPPTPVIKTEHTCCTVTLDFDPLALYADAVREFLSKHLSTRLDDTSATAFLKLVRFGAEIGFTPTREELRDHGITLADKRLTIEPRVGTPLHSRRYFTEAPLSSDGHLELLREFEGLMRRGT